MTQIKICGLTNLEDALHAAHAGADLLGFIFYAPSPRYLTPETAQNIIMAIRQLPRPPRCVGVFVNETAETMLQIMTFCGLNLLQLHGEEPPALVNQFQGRAYKAIRPSSLAEAKRLVAHYIPIPPVSLCPDSPPPLYPDILLDAYHPTLYGGTGEVTDWGMAAEIAAEYPVMLAGSLTAENVGAAIQAVQPWGVDVSSGVEATKGKKDPAKVTQFIQIIRN